MKAVVLSSFLATVVLAGMVAAAGPPTPGGFPPPPPGPPPGTPPDYVPEQGVNPPEEPLVPASAYQACEGRALGERAQFQAKDGRTISGACVEYKGRLVLKPDLPPPRSPGALPKARAAPGS